jgi:hypothetical protein
MVSIFGRVAAEPPMGINTNQAHINSMMLELGRITLEFDGKCGSLDPMLSELMKNSNSQEILPIITALKQSILINIKNYISDLNSYINNYGHNLIVIMQEVQSDSALLDSIKATIVKQDQLIQRIENLESVFQLIESTETQLSTIAQHYKGTALTDNWQKTIIQLVEKISIDEYGKITDMENEITDKIWRIKAKDSTIHLLRQLLGISKKTDMRDSLRLEIERFKLNIQVLRLNKLNGIQSNQNQLVSQYEKLNDTLQKIIKDQDEVKEVLLNGSKIDLGTYYDEEMTLFGDDTPNKPVLYVLSSTPPLS